MLSRTFLSYIQPTLKSSMRFLHTKSPHFDLLCCKPQSRQYFGQDLHNYLRNSRSETFMNLEAFQDVPNAVEQVDKSIVAGANVLSRLTEDIDFSVIRPE